MTGIFNIRWICPDKFFIRANWPEFPVSGFVICGQDDRYIQEILKQIGRNCWSISIDFQKNICSQTSEVLETSEVFCEIIFLKNYRNIRANWPY